MESGTCASAEFFITPKRGALGSKAVVAVAVAVAVALALARTRPARMPVSPNLKCSPHVTAETFSKIVVKKMGCDMETGEDMLKCIRSKKADDFFMKKKDWPRNETIPPLAPDMPFG